MAIESRIMSDPEVVDAVQVLTGLSRNDLRLVLQMVSNERATHVNPAGMVRQQQTDRFCEPSDIDAGAIADATVSGLNAALEAGFAVVQLSPLVPLGANAHFGSVDQSNVVATTRLNEITGDPTTALAMVGIARRRSLRDRSEPTRLAAIQRVARSQQFDAPGALAHFSMLGLVSIAPDRGRRRFEIEEITSQVKTLVQIIDTIDPPGGLRIELGDNTGRRDELEAMAESLSAIARTDVVAPRPATAGYAPNLWARVLVATQDDLVEVAETNVAPLAEEFVDTDKERMVMSRLGLDHVIELRPRQRRQDDFGSRR